MDESDRAIAFARVQKRVHSSLLCAPAHLALDISSVRVNNSAVNLNGFFSIKLIFTVVSVVNFFH